MTSSFTDVFLTAENLHKTPAKILVSLFRGAAWPLRPYSGGACGAMFSLTRFDDCSFLFLNAYFNNDNIREV